MRGKSSKYLGNFESLDNRVTLNVCSFQSKPPIVTQSNIQLFFDTVEISNIQHELTHQHYVTFLSRAHHILIKLLKYQIICWYDDTTL